MNYLTILLIVLLLLSLVELSFAKHKVLCDQLFHIAFAFTAFWVGIKYYIGPDIFSYVPFYETIQPLKDILGGHYKGDFEIGFAIFCSLLKSIGLSFWGMTVVITAIYFAAIYKVFKQLKSYRTFALCVLMLLDYNLALYEFRQCLAVSLFILSYYAWAEKKYLKTLLIITMAIFIHKSAIFIYLGTLLIYVFKSIKISKKSYILLGIIFILMLLIPPISLFEKIINEIPLSKTVYISLIHHLSEGKILQLILPVYLLTIFCLAYYGNFSKENKKWHWFMWCFIAVIVILFQYWFLLNRIRSYFTLFLLVYTINTLVNSQRKDILPKQLLVLTLIIYSVLFISGNYIKSLNQSSHTNNISTIFDRLHHSEDYLRNQQMKEATIYWKKDYLKE